MADDSEKNNFTDLGSKKNAEPIYYYSREHRLSNASNEIRDMNDGKPIRPSLRKTLFATRGNIVLFISIIIICIAASLIVHPSGKEATVKLGGNSVNVVILNYDGVLILGLEKTSPKSGEAYSGIVDIAVSPVAAESKKGDDEEAPPLFSNRIFFTPQETERFQVTLPFSGTNFMILLRTENEMKTLKITASEGK